jgi:hypothetical protein
MLPKDQSTVPGTNMNEDRLIWLLHHPDLRGATCVRVGFLAEELAA